jgi:hypothetical protein
MIIPGDNNPQYIFDEHFSLSCPHCGAYSNITAISIPRYEFLVRFKPAAVGIVYRCDSCNSPIFLRFAINNYDLGNRRIILKNTYQEVERPSETFDFTYLKGDVEEDFREALTCYSNLCFNAFASMCRRTVQSVCTNLGTQGKDKVLKQLKDLKDMAEIDDDTFGLLKQIIIEGHDGAHPHLPKLNQDRAAVLLELMKDVLYQLYVRKGKLQEAMSLRKQAIEGQAGGNS